MYASPLAMMPTVAASLTLPLDCPFDGSHPSAPLPATPPLSLFT